jgi:DNA polymerase-4
MTALQEVTPEIEIFSVDEAFLDLSACQYVFGNPVSMALRAKEIVFRVSGLLCSVGVSGDKTTAKHAAKQKKPDGFTVVPPWEAREYLHDLPLTDLCGIKKGIGGFLEKRGIKKCADMARLPISTMAERFGNPGRRIWLMAQGQDPDPIHTNVPSPKSIGHGKIMPPATKRRDVITTYLLHMSEKVGARLRKHQMEAQRFYIGMLSDHGYIYQKFKTARPTDDGREIYELCKQYLARHWDGWGAHQVQITALDPRPANMQPDFFLPKDQRIARRNAAMDKINERYGAFTLAPAPLLNRSEMPNVISPAWKPTGHRQTI